MKKYLAILLSMSLTMTMVLSACSSSTSSSEDIPDVIKVGVVNPTTGDLAGLGEGTPWVDQLMVDYINDELGGIYLAEYDATIPVEFIVYDSQSSSTLASELAQKLVEEDKVDLLIARHTPDTAIPVDTIAERYGVPCISVEMPTDVWVANGPFEYSLHAHWVLEDVASAFIALWQQQGYGPGSTVGFLLPSDADGIMFREYFTPLLTEMGYNIVDPGEYPVGTSDFTSIIEAFKSGGVEVVLGINITPDFGSYILQAEQMGFSPDVVTNAKATLTVADAESIGADLIDGMCTEVWWSVDRGFTSELTGMTSQEFADLYMEEVGRTITPPMASKYASYELLYYALTEAGTLDADAIMDALATFDAETMMGFVKYNEDGYSALPVTGGQWQVNEAGEIELIIVDTSNDPSLPTTGTMESLN